VDGPFTGDVCSDVVCPPCFIGARHHSGAFELDPTAALRHDLSLDELVAHEYSFSLERAPALHARLGGQARELNTK
jgi:predicted DsbA family dithiol-disulfide isomerase